MLPTAVELARKQVEVNVMCSWCHEKDEEGIHTLFTCSFARILLNEVGLQEVTNIDEGIRVKDVLKRVFNGSACEKCVRIGLFCWGLWTRRNTWVRDRKATSVFGVRSMATSMLQEWQHSQVNAEKEGRDRYKLPKNWCKPPEG